LLVRNGVLLGEFTNPQLICSLIPRARHISFKGHELVVLPHRLDETLILKNLGLNPPSPILTQFDWPGRFAPMSHQRETAAFLSLHKRAFCLNDMGTGKTAAALWAAEYLRRIGQIDEIIVVCPLSVLGVWQKEAFAILPHRSCELMAGERSKRLKILRSKADIKVINFDGLKSIADEVAQYVPGKRILVIVDEASTYRTYGNKRYKALKGMITPKTWLWLMTGTPVPNAPTDAWALAKLINPKKVPNSFNLFRETVMKPAGPYKWIPRPGATKIAFDALQPAIRFMKSECLDLPPVTYNDRICEMTVQQKVAFDNFKKKMKHEDKEAGVSITAANAAVRLLKMQQVFCGVVKDDDEQAVWLDNAPRLALTEELIEDAGGKVIVFAPFLFSMAQLQRHLNKRWRTALVNGKTPKHERIKIFDEFQEGNSIDVLIAHPSTAAHGLTLTAASNIIWFAPTFSLEHYEQGNARIERTGQLLPCSIFHIGCHPVEWAIYEALQKKSAIQSALLGMYQRAMAA
jgi:SNF2 family DNA or RNA helicase